MIRFASLIIGINFCVYTACDVIGGPAGGPNLKTAGEIVIGTKLGLLRGLVVDIDLPLFTHSGLMGNQEPPKQAYNFMQLYFRLTI